MRRDFRKHAATWWEPVGRPLLALDASAAGCLHVGCSRGRLLRWGVAVDCSRGRLLRRGPSLVFRCPLAISGAVPCAWEGDYSEVPRALLLWYQATPAVLSSVDPAHPCIYHYNTRAFAQSLSTTSVVGGRNSRLSPRETTEHQVHAHLLNSSEHLSTGATAAKVPKTKRGSAPSGASAAAAAGPGGGGGGGGGRADEPTWAVDDDDEEEEVEVDEDTGEEYDGNGNDGNDGDGGSGGGSGAAAAWGVGASTAATAVSTGTSTSTGTSSGSSSGGASGGGGSGGGGVTSSAAQATALAATVAALKAEADGKVAAAAAQLLRICSA